MFEKFDYDYIMNKLLARISDDLDKREGSIIYDALAPAALEIANFYINLDMVVNESFADSSSYYYLIKRAAERNLYPMEATKSILKGKFIPEGLEVKIGSRFSLNSLNYVVTLKLDNEDAYQLECETEGTIGNQQLGIILPIEYVPGLEKAELTEVLIPGEDEENVETFRERYFSSFKSQSYGGNVADYKKIIYNINGVGGVKVYPVWNGGGTVKTVIISSEYIVPTNTVINLVQDTLDPLEISGKGGGLAPIGHKVTVEGVIGRTINFEFEIEYASENSFESLKKDILETIDNFLLELNKTWDSMERLIVRISQIEAALLKIDGIIDINSTKINGIGQNLKLEENEVAVRGEIIG